MIAGKSVLALITARGGSKGVPGKNILPIGGRPLIQWTIDAARASRYVDRLVLSSDDRAIIEVALSGGCEVPFRRDSALASDEASSIDVVIDALQRVPDYDIVLLLQPTSPLRNTADIDGALELLAASAAPACVSVRAAEEHPYWTFRLDDAGRLRRYAEPAGGLPLHRQELARRLVPERRHLHRPRQLAAARAQLSFCADGRLRDARRALARYRHAGRHRAPEVLSGKTPLNERP